MGVNFTPRESRVLYRLWAENTADIIVKTDRDGFVVHATPAIERMGFPLQRGSGQRGSGRRHVLDLVDPSRGAAVMAEHQAAIAGRQDGAWVEFPARRNGGRERWFAIQLRGLADERGAIYGAVGIVRSIEERRGLERKLFAASLTDPLTGLTNRSAFVTMVRHLLEGQVACCLALFDIDHFKAINLRCGQAAGDAVLVAVAGFLRSLTRSEDIISRIGSESFGILLPRVQLEVAEATCREVVRTLSDISGAAGKVSLPVTVSAGLTRIDGSLDETMKRAELALAVAKAKGRNRLETDRALLRLAGEARAGGG